VGSSARGTFVKILGRGELKAKLKRVRPRRVRRQPRRRSTDAGGSVTLIPVPFKAEGRAGRPAGQGQPVHQSLNTSKHHRASPPGPRSLCDLEPEERLQGRRPPQQILFTLAMIALYRFGVAIRVPGIDADAVNQFEEGVKSPGSARVPQPVLRRSVRELLDLRPRDHAVHHRPASSCRSSAS
jgi:hypothetical protein